MPMLWTQRGSELLPTDEEGNLLFDDVSHLETWKVHYCVHYTLNVIVCFICRILLHRFIGHIAFLRYMVFEKFST